MANIWTYIVLGRLDEVTHDGEEECLGDGGEQPSVEARTTEDSRSDDWAGVKMATLPLLPCKHHHHHHLQLGVRDFRLHMEEIHPGELVPLNYEKTWGISAYLFSL